MLVIVVPPIVADYVKYTTLAKIGKKKVTRLRNASLRDRAWQEMNSNAQWLAVDILSGDISKYKVATDE